MTINVLRSKPRIKGQTFLNHASSLKLQWEVIVKMEEKLYEENEATATYAAFTEFIHDNQAEGSTYNQY